MTNRVEPPVVYRHWSGTLRVVRGGGAGWPYPRMEYRDGSWWLEYIDADDWRPIGYGPRRPGRWARFWSHWHHGRLMRYPRLSVLVFAVRMVLERR